MLATLFAAILSVSPNADPAPMEIRKYDDTYEFYLAGELVTKYHVAATLSQPFLWPLNAPGQVPVTRSFPIIKAQAGESTDHVHHKSAWLCHGDVIPVGVELPTKVRGVQGVDFWSENAGHGKIAVASIDKPNSSGDRCRLETRNAWKTPEGRIIVEESRSIELVPLEKARLIVVRSRLKATTAPIVWGDTKEGGFAVRVSDQLCTTKNPSSKISNSTGGVGEAQCWGRKADWCDYSGVVNGKDVGVAVFDHPSNRHRASWHVRGYGLLSANPFGRKDSGFPSQKDSAEPPARINVGEELVLRYGILLHTGDAVAGRVAEHFRTFRALE